MNRKTSFKSRKEITTTFAVALEKVMKQQCITTAQLADRLNVSEVTVYQWLAGRNIPNVYHICAICERLPITPNELLGY